MRPLPCLTLGLSFLLSLSAIGAARQHSPSSPAASNAQAAATARIVAAAEAVLATLDMRSKYRIQTQ